MKGGVVCETESRHPLLTDKIPSCSLPSCSLSRIQPFLPPVLHPIPQARSAAPVLPSSLTPATDGLTPVTVVTSYGGDGRVAVGGWARWGGGAAGDVSATNSAERVRAPQIHIAIQFAGKGGAYQNPSGLSEGDGGGYSLAGQSKRKLIEGQIHYHHNL
jgi:hypothetical protein